MSNVSGSIKSIQDIMRKDVGVDGDAQRISQLVWMLFLKIYDDRETELELLEDSYQSPLPENLRWRSWAANREGMTGETLNDFVNLQLFPFLKEKLNFQGPTGQRALIIHNIFENTYNYMKSGTLVRQVINKLCEIDFNNTEDRHTFGNIYEQILKGLQSAGNSGEFYTPRVVTQFIVDRVNPKLKDSVLDPACGTGGFLTCAIDHKRDKYVKNDADEQVLVKSIQGVEKKSLPHMLCITNMILHGIELPTMIKRDNTLARPLRDYTEADRVDVIVANPPFGGTEEDGIEHNFPLNIRTKETADLFLALIIRLLKNNGRAGIILPEGSMFGGGVKSRIKELLMTECDLHTVVRLPKGVFEPYTDIATNLLFFTKGKATSGTWFYEHPLPERRAHLKGKCYSASDNIESSEFNTIKSWWGNRKENEYAWYVSIEKLTEEKFDLDQRHPKRANVSLPSPQSISTSMRRTTNKFLDIMESIESLSKRMRKIDAPMIELSKLLIKSTNRIQLADEIEYRRPTVKMRFRGMKLRDRKFGHEIGSKTQTIIRSGDLIFSRIDAHNGAMAIIPDELDGAVVTNDFPTYAINLSKITSKYLRYMLFQPSMVEIYYALSKGSTNRRRIVVDKLMALKIPVPLDLKEQIMISENLGQMENMVASAQECLGGIEEDSKIITAASLHHVFVSQQQK
jgi:type I restriction enzyme M protein